MLLYLQLKIVSIQGVNFTDSLKVFSGFFFICHVILANSDQISVSKLNQISQAIKAQYVTNIWEKKIPSSHEENC